MRVPFAPDPPLGKDPWNYFDTSLVLFWIAEKVLSAYDAVLDQGLLRGLA